MIKILKKLLSIFVGLKPGPSGGLKVRKPLPTVTPARKSLRPIPLVLSSTRGKIISFIIIVAILVITFLGRGMINLLASGVAVLLLILVVGYIAVKVIKKLRSRAGREAGAATDRVAGGAAGAGGKPISKYKESLAEAKAKAYMERGIWLTPFWRQALKIIVGLIIVGIVLYGIFGTTIGGGLLAKTDIDVGDLWSKLVVGTLHAAEKIKQQATGVGEWKNPYATETKEKKGVEISKIIIQQSYLPNQDVEIASVGFIRSLEEPTKVSFSCSLDKKTVGEIIGEEYRNVQPNVKIPFGVGCKLNTGPKTTDPTYKKFKFNAEYTKYITTAKLKLWVLPGEEAEKLIEGINPIDPFDKYREDFEAQRFDELLRLDEFRSTRSSYRYGPLIISMKVFESQPLSENNYNLFIDIKNDKLSWGGEIKKGKLEFKFPDNVDQGSCYDIEFGNEDVTKNCVFTIESIERGLNVIEIEAKAVYDYIFSKEVKILVSEQGASKIDEKKESSSET